ncbi:hypothetical protein SDC9_04305 [bioreactor metagenome]|uniref:Uncharacterized protein n=1 Tax=bioreactor metagenome TaxID=1076179 RepID=A0A644SVX2_9ZZZZ
MNEIAASAGALVAMIRLVLCHREELSGVAISFLLISSLRFDKGLELSYTNER